MKYKHGILGGTFDHLHRGHKHLIGSAFESCEKVTIGLATEEIYQDKEFSFSIQTYDARLGELSAFLEKEELLERAKIIPIHDIFGSSLSDQDIDAIFVSNHGLANAKIINAERKRKGYAELEINKVDFIKGDDNRIISSTRIRGGEINRNGNSYFKVFQNTKELVLGTNLRSEVENIPSGKLIKGEAELREVLASKEYIVTVGDVISLNVSSLGRQQEVAIIDLKVQKEVIASVFRPNMNVINPAGVIRRSAASAIKKALLKCKGTVVGVVGEEDLLALPCALLAPLKSIVLYGMPNKGAIAAEITEEKKEEVKNVLLRFARHN